MESPDRWPRRLGRQDEGWRRDAAALLASRHSEAREAMPTPLGMPEGWAAPRPRPDEKKVLGIYASHWLFEVIDPPGWGYRLVNVVVDGQALTWDLPGYNRRDAETICVAFLDGYL